MKVTSNIEYIVNWANDHIESAHCIHVLKEEANISSLSLITEPSIASQALVSSTIPIANSPTVSEERDLPSIVDSTVSENLKAVLLIESMKAAPEYQMRTNNMNTKALEYSLI